MIVGVDACKGGWVAVILTKNYHYKVELFTNIGEMWHRCSAASLILIDVPIGLKQSGIERLCDLEARRLLGAPRSSSVFPVPCRPAVYTLCYNAASDINEQQTGRKLSKQTWGITPKIREVDQFLRNNLEARKTIREIHPELCFWALAGQRAMDNSKKTTEGVDERKQVLNSIFSQTDKIVSESQSNLVLRNRAGTDDVIDALAAAVTGLHRDNQLSSIPGEPEHDDILKMPMEMVFRLMN